MSLAIDRPRAQTAATKTHHKNSEWAQLAGLRFLLALLVVNYHLGGETASPAHFNWFWQFSNAAVPGFFVISGYSIAHSLRNDSAGFYQRRLLRIAPVYLTCLLISLLPFVLHGSSVIYTPAREILHAPSVWLFLGNAVGVQGYLCPHIETISAIWTLAIECGFYALAPLFAKMSSQRIVMLILISALLFLNESAGPINLVHKVYGVSSILLLWIWLMGFLFYRYRDSNTARVALVGFGAVVMAARLHEYLGSEILFSLVLAAIAWARTVQLAAQAIFLSRWGEYGGEISYPLYLVHQPIMYALLGSALPNQPTHFPIWIVIPISLLAAGFVYHIVDISCRKLAHRLHFVSAK